MVVVLEKVKKKVEAMVKLWSWGGFHGDGMEEDEGKVLKKS